MRFCAFLLLVVACGGSPEAQRDPTADASVVADAGEQCAPFAELSCRDGNVHWLDSCGIQAERVEECLAPRVCVDDEAACCIEATEGNFSGLESTTRLLFNTPQNGSSATFEIEVLAAAAGANGRLQYAGLGATTISNGATNSRDFGLDLSSYSDIPNSAGPVAIFYQGGISSLAELEPGPGAGTRINGDIGFIARPVSWTSGGSYSLRVAREEDAGTFYLAAYVTEPGSSESLIGRISYGTSNVEFSTNPSLRTGLLVSQGTFPYLDFAELEVAFSRPLFSPANFQSAELQYNSFPNSDGRYDPGDDRVYISQGANTPRCARAGPAFSP